MAKRWAVLATLLAARGAVADQVTFPLTVDYPLLAAAVREQLRPEPDGTALLWGTRDGCRSLTLRDLRFESTGARVRLRANGAARVGFSFLGFCIAPVGWKGILDTLATPSVDADWRLRLQDPESQLYDEQGKSTLVASRVWQVVKPHLEDEVLRFSLDLGPPVDEARALLRAAAGSAAARPVVEALATMHPVGVEVREEGLRVIAAVDVPARADGAMAPEPALTPVELEKWQAALESWDGFLVFVIKSLGSRGADEPIRQELFTLLLSSRQKLLAALAGGPEAGVDPVRELFLDAWDRLRGPVREAAARGTLDDRALRYVAFIAAGDALAALDAAGPSLGLEISADGLRRLARILEPDYVGDPVAYSETSDPALRALFEFHDPAPTVPSPAPPDAAPDGSWFRLGPTPAYAAPVVDAELASLGRRLDRWVPRADELDAYRDAVARLLALVADRTAATNRVGTEYAQTYRHLVATTAWQESCWRQFVERGGRVTYLLSSTGDIGMMQVNRRVWRGFFDVEKLEWDLVYNAGAGAEILAQLFTRYGVREAKAGLDNAVRATYAAYNGGPDAFRRYRLGKVPRRLRAIDLAFWEKYQAMAAGRALDYVLCVEKWNSRGGSSRARLSTAPVASTPKCCISSRSSSATPTMVARHVSIASRPRASLV